MLELTNASLKRQKIMTDDNKVDSDDVPVALTN